jgi:hypothetical protein
MAVSVPFVMDVSVPILMVVSVPFVMAVSVPINHEHGDWFVVCFELATWYLH